jgi:hypothetical protein
MNVMGYYGVFVGLKFRHDNSMTRSFDQEDFDVSRTIELKIPVSIPYATDAEEYQRVDGKFEHNGEVYRLIKQKYSRDTLSIICIRDERAKEINQALASYVRTFSDNQSSGTSDHHVISLIKDYLPENENAVSSIDRSFTIVANSSPTKTFVASFLSEIVHPPERA